MMGENKMESYEFLLSLAIILLSTKVFGLITEKVHLPQVVGAILAGVILDPSCLGLLEQSDFLTKASEIGVIMLMFIAGLDTDLQEIKKKAPPHVSLPSWAFLCRLSCAAASTGCFLRTGGTLQP